MKSTVARILFASLILLNHANAQFPCSGEGACEDSTSLACTAAVTCSCIGKAACKSSDITCASGVPCEIWCTGEDACQDSSIDASAATSLTLICSGKASCKEMETITCPTASTAYTCVLSCDGEDSCSGSEVDTTGAFSCTALNNAVCPDDAITTTAAPVTPAPVTPAPVVLPTVATTGAPTLEPITGSPTVEPTTASPVTPAPVTIPTTAAPVTPAPVTTTEVGDDDDDSSDSSSSDDMDVIGAAAGLFNEGDDDIDSLFNDEVESGGVQNLVVSLSETAIGNLWGMAILFILVNAMLCYCYHRKQKKQRAEFKQDPLP